MRSFVLATVVCAVGLFACSKSSSPTSSPSGGDDIIPGTVADAFVPGSDAASSRETGGADAPSSEVAVDATFPDADFGPVPDAVVGEGATVDPPPSPAPLAFCTQNTTELTTGSLLAAGVTAKAFADAWNTEAAKTTGGAVLIELRGLESDPPSFSVAVGSSDSTVPPKFLTTVPGPGVNGATIDATSRALSSSAATASFSIKIGGATIPIGRFALNGTLDGKCQGLGAATLTLFIPASAGSIAFAGSTVGALLGEPTDVIGTADAWRVELTGSATYAGGS